MKKVALLLDDRSNLYQELLHREAKACADRFGAVVLEPEFADGSSWTQIELINAHLRETPRPDAILIMLAGEQFTRACFERVVKAGIAVAFLNRIPAWMDELRSLFPGAFVAGISPHQRRVGEIQAEQAIRLTQPGAFIILVTGSAASATAIDRRQGFLDNMKDHYVIQELDGRWEPNEAEKALSDWFRFGVDRKRPIDLVVCQNDAMARGVHKVLAKQAAATGRRDLENVRLIGCDGLTKEGQAMIAQRTLTATVVMPPTTPTALEMLSRYWELGLAPASVQLNVSSFPDLSWLSVMAKLGNSSPGPIPLFDSTEHY